MMALSALNLNKRGFGFPSWGFGVNVPISTKPKPKFENSLNNLQHIEIEKVLKIQFLSKI